MQLFVRILNLLDSLIRSMMGNDFLGAFIGLAAFAIIIGMIYRVRRITA